MSLFPIKLQKKYSPQIFCQLTGNQDANVFTIPSEDQMKQERRKLPKKPQPKLPETVLTNCSGQELREGFAFAFATTRIHGENRSLTSTRVTFISFQIQKLSTQKGSNNKNRTQGSA